MPRVACLTDLPQTPSSRFRVRQFVPLLQEQGIDVIDFPRRHSRELAGRPDRRIRHSPALLAKACVYELLNLADRFRDVRSAKSFDAILISRELMIGYPSFEFLIKKPLILDVDDAIFLNGRLTKYAFDTLAQKADLVLAGNQYLSDVITIPTSVDTDRWKPPDIKGSAGHFIVGWCGTSTSFPYFEPLQDALAKFLHDTCAKFRIMSDRFPRELDILRPYVEFSQWSEEEEVQFIQGLDVGLMPLRDDEWAKGKCAYKMLLYAACSVPVVVSPFGVNGEILREVNLGIGAVTSADWYDALCSIFNNRKLAQEMGRAGVKHVKDKYSVLENGKRIAQAIRDIL